MDYKLLRDETQNSVHCAQGIFQNNCLEAKKNFPTPIIIKELLFKSIDVEHG